MRHTLRMMTELSKNEWTCSCCGAFVQRFGAIQCNLQEISTKTRWNLFVCSRVWPQMTSILNQESDPCVQTQSDPAAVSVCLLKSGVADLLLAARWREFRLKRWCPSDSPRGFLPAANLRPGLCLDLQVLPLNPVSHRAAAVAIGGRPALAAPQLWVSAPPACWGTCRLAGKETGFITSYVDPERGAFRGRERLGLGRESIGVLCWS